MSKAQYGQDLFILRCMNFKENGFFVDVGAYDGLLFSNTYFMEKFLNWRGICIEPNPASFSRLKEIRLSTCLNYAVSDFEGTMQLPKTYEFRSDALETHLTTDDEKVDVPVKTLTKILDENSCPTEIDYLSIDTDGFDLNVLKSIDFNKYKIKYISIEHNHDENLRSEFWGLLKNKYKFKAELGVDDIYELKSPQSAVEDYYKCLTLYNVLDYPKIRIGTQDGDGGYIILDGLKYKTFLSAGLADNVDFEIEFSKLYDIPCLAFDGTIDSCSIPYIKKNIDINNTKTLTNLDEYITDNTFLKMDIEGSEFVWLNYTSKLPLISQMVIEIHNPFDVNKINVLEKIAKTHVLCHAHANNAGGIKYFGNYQIPQYIECTYIRRDIVHCLRVNTEPLPTILDKQNVGRPDLKIAYPPLVN